MLNLQQNVEVNKETCVHIQMEIHIQGLKFKSVKTHLLGVRNKGFSGAYNVVFG